MIRHNSETVKKARELRRRKLSFQEIGRILTISSSTVRNWCYDLGIDRHESLRVNNEYRRNILRNRDLHFVPSVDDISSEQACLFAAILYGCEGSKYPSSNFLGFTNSDPHEILHRLREFSQEFLSMSSLPDLIWWLQPELASKMPEIKE